MNGNDMQVYRNLAISRLVKKALETAGAESSMPVASGPGYISGRSDSRTPEFSALWKTRVG